MPYYQLDKFDDGANFVASETMHSASDAAIKAKAGKMAKRSGGPIDILRAGRAPHNERYITTAMLSDVHVHGYRLERLT